MSIFKTVQSAFKKLWQILYNLLLRPVIVLAEKIHYPGVEGVSLAYIARFFRTGIQRGGIQMRASALSFDFFLAIFPAIIFFFTLIPYIPVTGLEDKIMNYIQDVLPPFTFEATKSTILDILSHQRGGLLSFGFLFAMIVSVNGIKSMIEGFNLSYHGVSNRTGLMKWFTAFLLTLMVAFLVIFAISLIIVSEVVTDYLATTDFVNNSGKIILLRFIITVILLIGVLVTISCLYYFGPSKHHHRPFISVGSVTATFLLAITSIGFNYFISNFSQYNRIYGSIGTLIIILVWINFNTLQLLIGFELNASIENAITSRHQSQESDSENKETA